MYYFMASGYSYVRSDISREEYSEMKTVYDRAFVEVVMVDAKDIITTSTPPVLPIDPFSDEF